MLPIRTKLRFIIHPCSGTKNNRPTNHAVVRAARRYLGNRPEQLDYAYALALDLPVGSGMIESGHRPVIQARSKKAGAWWTSAHLHAMCQLRTLRANLPWDLYWSRN